MHYRTIWRLPDVMAQTGLSRSTIYDLVSQEKFPSQINLGPRAVGWVASEVVDWIEGRIDRISCACVPSHITRKLAHFTNPIGQQTPPPEPIISSDNLASR